MEIWLPDKAMVYIRNNDAEERVLLSENIKLFEKQTREQLMSDNVLVKVREYKNMYELRIRGRRGHHRFLGPVIDEIFRVAHCFLKQGKQQEQKEYKTAWERSKKYLVYFEK